MTNAIFIITNLIPQKAVSLFAGYLSLPETGELFLAKKVR